MVRSNDEIQYPIHGSSGVSNIWEHDDLHKMIYNTLGVSKGLGRSYLQERVGVQGKANLSLFLKDTAILSHTWHKNFLTLQVWWP